MMRKQLLIFILAYQHSMAVGMCIDKLINETLDEISSTPKKCPAFAVRSRPVPHRPRFPLPLHEIFKFIVTPPPQLTEKDCGGRSFEPEKDVKLDDKLRKVTMEGATTTQVREWPWMAHITAGGQKCSGILITNQHVLTTASCLKPHKAQDVKVCLGAIARLGAANATLKNHTREFRIENFKYHEDFVDSTKVHDIAIIKLEKRANMTDYHIYPICLPFNIPLSRTNFSSKYGFLSGFNTKDDTLQVVSTKIIGNNECSHQGVKIESFHICAGGSIYNQDYCWKDWGGALMANYFGKWYGLGVVSHHKSCIPDTRDSAVSTRITSYLEWIKYYFL